MQNEPRNQLRAAVMAGGTFTPYAVAGSGPPAVLLAEHPATSDLGSLARELGCRFVAPETPLVLQPTDAGVDWLSDFLDGLGLDAITLVSAEGGHELASQFAMASPERVCARATVDARGALTWTRDPVALPRP